MRDIESLKQRIEAAEKHNASSELARNRESEALMDMWHQIRTRFTDQEDEIARYRSWLEEMTQKNLELGRMVDELLATVEGNLDRARDETVTRIANLAEALLASKPSPFASAEQHNHQINELDETESEVSSFNEALMAVSNIDDEDADIEADDTQPERSVPDLEVVRSVLDLIAADDVTFDAPAESPAEEAELVVGETLSERIRDIISRVEDMSSSGSAPIIAVDSTLEADPSDNRDARPDEFLYELLGNLKSADEKAEPATRQDDALDQELREIESLHSELSGLRDRISTGDSSN